MARRMMIALAVTALTASTTLLPIASASADVVNVWTTYPSMSACKGDLLNLNNYCYGLQDGQALGLIDAALTIDVLDEATGIDHYEEDVLPSPEGPSNPVVEVWNNTPDYTFLAAGTSVFNDATNGLPVYYIPPGEDLIAASPIDATAQNGTYKVVQKKKLTYVVDTFFDINQDGSLEENDFELTTENLAGS